METNKFIDILNNNYDEIIELSYVDKITQHVKSARFVPVEHGKEYCDVTYIDTRNDLFFQLTRPVYRGLVFKAIPELESLVAVGEIKYSESPVDYAFLEKRKSYMHEYKEKVAKVAKAKELENSKKGVYVVKMGKYVKIGVSINFKSRLSSMQTACAEPLELICFFHGGSYSLEKELHGIFENEWVRGEWFNSKIIGKILKLHTDYEKIQNSKR